MKFEVIDEQIRLDKYLIDKLDISRSKLQEMIKKELILVNQEPKKNSYILKTNDVVEVLGKLDYEPNISPVKMKLDIIYEDDDLMVINKPSGLVVHPSIGNHNNTLVNGLLYYTNNLSNENGDLRPGIVHRLDKDTSGLLIVAKNNKAHVNLSNQLKNRSLSRIYIALVDGVINHNTGTIDAPIGRCLTDRKKMCVTSLNSKSSITDFKVLEKYSNATLVECHLKTGRTHQIRVHMAYINHPIINDPIYNNKNATEFGQMLHAKEISFIHPTTNLKMNFKVDPPKEFYDILNKYKKGSDNYE